MIVHLKIISNLTKEPVENTGNVSYDKYRFTLGLAEGGTELKYKGMALEASLQHFNGIAIRKGCYLGQELIARVYYKGMIRKSILGIIRSPLKSHSSRWVTPQNVRLHEDYYETENQTHIGEQGTSILNTKGRSIGTLISSVGNIGIAMLRHEGLKELDDTENSTNPLFTIDGDKEHAVSPIMPHWWKL